MEFIETALKRGLPDPAEKDRGSLGLFRACLVPERVRGTRPEWVQCNVSFSRVRGTVRGMHYQVAPCAEAKLVRCTRGAIYDVILDLRRESATYKQHVLEVLSGNNYKALFIPEGFAHGFQTLEANSEVFYQMLEFYSPEHRHGLHYNEPAFKINWPLDVTVISDRDRTYQ